MDNRTASSYALSNQISPKCDPAMASIANQLSSRLHDIAALSGEVTLEVKRVLAPYSFPADEPKCETTPREAFPEYFNTLRSGLDLIEYNLKAISNSINLSQL